MRAILTALLVASPAAADIAGVVNDRIRSGYADFATAARALADLDSCDPEILRPAFHDAYDAWMAVSHIGIGPAEDGGRALAVHFWPDPDGLGGKAQEALLIGDPATLTPESFARQPTPVRGLPALERLLYPSEELPADPCPLIHATADDMALLADELAAGWGPYGDLLLDAGQPGNTPYPTESGANEALFAQLVTGTEFIAEHRIGGPLGSFAKPAPERAEARASARSLRNVILSLHALRDLAVTLHPDSPKSAAAFANALRLTEDLKNPAFQRLSDGYSWSQIARLQQGVRAARDAVVAEIGPALGVTLAVDLQDGD